MYKILVSDKLGQAGLDLLDAADDVSYDLKLKHSKEALIAILPEYDGWIVRSGTKPDADMIAAASKLKVIGRAGIGVDNIDLEAATKQGVVVMNTPGANSMATAEQALALMLAASRHTAHAHGSLKAGEWNRSAFAGQELYQKTLGVIGFGKIGRLVAERAQAFGMSVIAFDPYVSEDVARELAVTLVDLDDLLAQSDYLTLHTAATPETTHLINSDTIAQMKEGVIIVNAARGKLIDEAALAAGLDSGKIKAAALDVYEQEPPAPDNPLIGHAKVTHVPHLGASSVEAQRNVAVMVAEQVLDALRETEIRNAVNLPFDPGPHFAQQRPFMTLAEKIGSLQSQLADAPIERVEIEVSGTDADQLVRPVAAALLKGLLIPQFGNEVNDVNAPSFAAAQGITISQSKGLSTGNYNHIISSRVHWDGGQRIVSGVLFGGTEPRIVQVDEDWLDARPVGTLLYMRNKDVPGVIGQVGTILAAYQVNIGEWRMGRAVPGGEALSLINLDSIPLDAVMNALSNVSAITQVKLIQL